MPSYHAASLAHSPSSSSICLNKRSKKVRKPMKLGDPFPDFCAETNEGTIKSFHQWMGDSWAILFSHPADFTPVCTTELARAYTLSGKFNRKGVKLIALSCDSSECHRQWIGDIVSYQQQCAHGDSSGKDEKKEGTDTTFPFPIISDEKRVLATQLGMLDPMEMDSKGTPLTARAVFIIDPKKKMRLSLLYPASTGRNFDEILRVLDSLQLTDQRQVATPVDWKPGQECMVLPTIEAEEAAKLFGAEQIRTTELPSRRPYLRFVHLISQPGGGDSFQ